MHCLKAYFLSLHCKNFLVKTTQKKVVKHDSKILGTDVSNANFLGCCDSNALGRYDPVLWVATTQILLVASTQIICVAATQPF